MVQPVSEVSSLCFTCYSRSNTIPNSCVTCLHCVFKAPLSVHWAMLAVCTPILCEHEVVLYCVCYCRIQYDDETKKNSALILSVGTVDSDVKGYITAFRGIVVLYT